MSWDYVGTIFVSNMSLDDESLGWYFSFNSHSTHLQLLKMCHLCFLDMNDFFYTLTLLGLRTASYIYADINDYSIIIDKTSPDV